MLPRSSPQRSYFCPLQHKQIISSSPDRFYTLVLEELTQHLLDSLVNLFSQAQSLLTRLVFQLHMHTTISLVPLLLSFPLLLFGPCILNLIAKCVSSDLETVKFQMVLTFGLATCIPGDLLGFLDSARPAFLITSSSLPSGREPGREL